MIEASKKGKLASDVQPSNGHAAPSHLEFVAAAGIGALIGLGFVVLTLAGLSPLAWILLGMAMMAALVHIGLVAVGRAGLLSFAAGGRSQQDRDRQQPMADEGR